jgi:cobalt/nickel transport system permease protein
VAEKAAIAGIGLATALLVPPWPGALLIAAVSAGITLAAARVPPAAYAGVLAVPLGFVLLSGLAVAVSVTRDAAGTHLALTPASLAAARDVTCRAAGATASGLLLPLTTPVPQIVDALGAVGVPREIVETMVLLYRFLFALEGAARATVRAQAARLGFVSRRSATRSVGLFAAALFGKAMDRAGRLDLALASRGGTASLATLRPTRDIRPARIAGFALLYAAAALAATRGPLAP